MSQILRLWPVGLIAIGVLMLRERLRPPSPPPPPGAPTSYYRPYGESQEVPHE
jgi:hypothetical protein